MVGEVTELDENALEASLVTNIRFTELHSRTREHCWHVVRLVHRMRLLRGQEACCERWGSLLHQLWDASSHWNAGTVAGRLQLREAGLAQNTRSTEAVVQHIVTHLTNVHNMNPFALRGRRHEATAATPAAGHLHQGLARALKESTYTSEKAKADAEPRMLQLIPSARDAVAAAFRSDGSMQALPLFQEDARTVAHDRADSVVRERLQSWWRSEEGMDWRRERASIFGEKDDDLDLELGEAGEMMIEDET